MPTPRYLVTGGAGFIGSNLVAALTAAGERVRVLDNLCTGRWEHLDGIPQQSLIERIEGDIRDAAVVARASQGVEVVFHEAALGSVPRSVETPVESDAVNVGGTVTVLDVARRQGVRRVIFAASSAAYGETPALPKHEDMAPMPLSPYAVTKLACEQYLKVFADLYNLETLNLRYFNVFGPNQTPDGAYAAAIPRFLDAALRGQAIQIYGDGEQTRDFCYIDNTVRANLLGATTSKKLRGEIVNVAGGGSTTCDVGTDGCFDYTCFTGDSPTVSFKADVLPIFRNSCGLSSSCHGSESGPGGQHYLGPKSHDKACIFCGIADASPEERRERLVVATTPRVFVMLNRFPFAAGHLLIVPHAHASALEDLTREDHDALFLVVRESCVRLKRALRAEGLNVGLNLGAVAGAGVAAHLHVHVVPRWSGDTNFMPVIADTRVVPQALDATQSHLEKFFADLDGGDRGSETGP